MHGASRSTEVQLIKVVTIFTSLNLPPELPSSCIRHIRERNLETCDSFVSGLISGDVGFVLHLLSLLPPSTPEEKVEASEDLVICPQTTDKGLAKHGAGS